MKKVMLFLAMVAMLVAVAVPVMAQESCSDIVEAASPGQSAQDVADEVGADVGQVEYCLDSSEGLPSEGSVSEGTVPSEASSSASASASASGSASADANGQYDQYGQYGFLPETGGLPLGSILLLLAGVALVGSGLVFRRMTR